MQWTSKTERSERRLKTIKEWHRWFAWRPVEVNRTKTVWLEWVERKAVGFKLDGFKYLQWWYRFPEVRPPARLGKFPREWIFRRVDGVPRAESVDKN